MKRTIRPGASGKRNGTGYRMQIRSGWKRYTETGSKQRLKLNTSLKKFRSLILLAVVPCLLIGCASTTKLSAPIVETPKLQPIAPSLKAECPALTRMRDGELDPREALSVTIENIAKYHACSQMHAALIRAAEDRGL